MMVDFSTEEGIWTLIAICIGSVLIGGPLIAYAFEAGMDYRRKLHSKGKAKGLRIYRTPFHQTLWYWMYEQTYVGQLLDAFQTLVSGVSVILYVTETYVDAIAEARGTLSFDIAVVIFFSVYWAIQLLLAPNKVSYFFQVQSIGDIFAIIPVLVLGFQQAVNSSSLSFLRFIRLLRVYRLLRAFHILKNAPNFGVQRQIFILAFSTTAVVFCAAGLFHIVENTFGDLPEPQEFHQSFYFMLISVLGRPRIPVVSLAGYLTVTLTICISVVVIPSQVAKLIDFLRNDSSDKRVKMRFTKYSIRALLSGPGLTDAAMIQFLKEFFHECRRTVPARYMGIMRSEPASNEVSTLLFMPKFKANTTFMQGAVLKQFDLDRCDPENLQAQFLLCKKYSSDPEADDRQVMAQLMAVKRQNTRIRTFVQLRMPESAVTVMSLPAWNIDKDFVQCVEHSKAEIIGKSIVCPGLSTLLSNLLSTMGTQDAQDHEKNDSSSTWKQEYLRGAAHEIYAVSFPQFTHGKTFNEAVLYAWKETGVILFAMEMTSGHSGSDDSWVAIYPRMHVIQPSDLGFVIAVDEKTASKFSQLGSEDSSSHVVRMEYMMQGPRASQRMRTLAFDDTSSSLRNAEDLSDWSSLAAPTPGRKSMQRLRSVSLDTHSAANVFGNRTGGTRTSSPQPKPHPHSATLSEECNEFGQNEDLESTGSVWHGKESAAQTLRQLLKDTNGLTKEQARQQILKSIARNMYGGDVEKAQQELKAPDGKESGQPRMTRVDTIGYNVRAFRFGYDDEEGDPLAVKVVNQLHGHVVIAGYSFSTLMLIRSLRTKTRSLSSHLPIIVLSRKVPLGRERVVAREFSDVWQVYGHALNDDDLEACQLSNAKAAVVMNSSKSAASTDEDEIQCLIDADSILSAFRIVDKAPGIHLITELLEGLNTRFFDLRSRVAQNVQDWHRRPEFAAGRVFASSLLDIHVVQSFYSPNLPTLINELLACAVEGPDDQPWLHRRYSNQGLVTSNSSERYRKDEWKRVDGTAERFETDDENSDTTLFQVRIPESLHGSTFGQVFQTCLEYGFLCLGIYRSPGMGSMFSYVYTSPEESVKMHRFDKLFILASKGSSYNALWPHKLSVERVSTASPVERKAPSPTAKRRSSSLRHSTSSMLNPLVKSSRKQPLHTYSGSQLDDWSEPQRPSKRNSDTSIARSGNGSYRSTEGKTKSAFKVMASSNSSSGSEGNFTASSQAEQETLPSPLKESAPPKPFSEIPRNDLVISNSKRDAEGDQVNIAIV